jgi:hypothetical protein
VLDLALSSRAAALRLGAHLVLEALQLVVQGRRGQRGFGVAVP